MNFRKSIEASSALALAMALAVGSATAQGILDVGGAAAIGDTTLTTAKVPANGVNWTVVGGNGAPVSSSLISPAAVVPITGNVTLTFTHRYDFEVDFDGGAVFISVNGNPVAYLDGSAFTSNGYVGPTTGSAAWPGGQNVFNGQSAGYTTPSLITSVANLGSLNAGDTVSVSFRGEWDQGFLAGPPAWEIGTVKLTDSGATNFLNVDFASDGKSGFTVSNVGTVADPWTYLKPINRFEIDADALTADRYKPVSVGSVINLNDAKLQVVLLTGTLNANDTFTLFDLSGGTTLSGAIESISLPSGNWDTSNLTVNGKVKYLGPPIETIYTGPNNSGNLNTWNTADNWNNVVVPSAALNAIIPAGAYVVANDASTPAYTGNLSIGAGSTLQIGWSTVNPESYNALGTPGTSTITMGAGSLINTRNGGSPIIPAITLLGDAQISLGESSQAPASPDFDYSVSGAHTFTISSNQSTPIVDLNASNGFSALVINTLAGRGNPAGTFNANVAGSLGNGPITINANGVVSHQLAFEVAGASTAANTLNLNGEGPAGNGVGRVRMDANNTVGALTIYGFAYPAGTYGRIGSPGAPTNEVAWIEGDSVLTVATAPVSGPPTVAIADNFPSDSVFLGQKITYTLTFNEAVMPSTVDTGDFDNAGSATVTIDSVTSDLSFGVYKVVVTPTATGTVKLRVKSGAVITDLFGNNMVVPFTDPNTNTVGSITLAGQLGVWKQYANGGINPATGLAWAVGDTYRLIMVTSAKTTFLSNDIAYYNSFVQGVAAASTTYPSLGSGTWKVVGSTEAVNAKVNTGTDTGTGVAVILTDGSTTLATSNADLWDGTALRPDLTAVYMSAYLDENGIESGSGSIGTATNETGATVANQWFGDSNGSTNINTGVTRPNSNDRWMIQFNALNTASLRVYALSDPLTVQAVGAGSSYASWQSTNGAVGQAINLDHDNDGVSNGVEYFLGGNTNTTGFTPLPGVTNTAGALSITYAKAASYSGVYGTDYVVQTSTTLSGVWNDETVGGNVTVTGNDVKYTFPSPLSTKLFVRLKVTGP